jgi:hypothetical protein
MSGWWNWLQLLVLPIDAELTAALSLRSLPSLGMQVKSEGVLVIKDTLQFSFECAQDPPLVSSYRAAEELNQTR